MLKNYIMVSKTIVLKTLSKQYQNVETNGIQKVKITS